MRHYTDNRAALEALVQPHQVHRDIYTSPDVFQQEMKHLFANAWVFVGHESQTPQKGDYFSTHIGNQPVIQVRHSTGDIHVLLNRCPHKGTKIVIDRQGNTGKFFRCPYHAWSFKTDGCPLAIPLKKGYEGTGLEDTPSGQGMRAVGDVKNYRGFIFARLAEDGISFEDYFGDSLSSLDNMVDRSPAGRLEVVGPPLRYLHHCNWKMLVENQTDTCHPMVAHESSAGTAVKLYEELDLPEGAPKPAAMQIIAPFMSPYEFFEGMGIRTWPNGHGHTGVKHSIHSDYSEIPGYLDALTESYGAEKAQAILADNRHNTVYFPNIMIKGPIQQLRVFLPLAADRTIVESYIYRLVDAPDELIGAHRDVQPHDQRAHLHRGPRRSGNVRTRAGRADGGRHGMGQRPAPDRRGRGFRDRSGRKRHHRAPDAQPVPRLGQVHDHAPARGGGRRMTVTRETLIDFIYDEVRMLDEGRYTEWLDLWLPDGHYWMPLDYQQTDPINETSLMYEDMFMLKLRVERLNGARTFSQKPKSRCHHVIQRPFVDEMNEDRFVTTTFMHYVETRLDEQQLLAVTARHDLALVDGTLRIANKRVDIVNCDAAFRNIQLLP